MVKKGDFILNKLSGEHHVVCKINGNNVTIRNVSRSHVLDTMDWKLHTFLSVYCVPLPVHPNQIKLEVAATIAADIAAEDEELSQYEYLYTV